jgi:hypothetical protein
VIDIRSPTASRAVLIGALALTLSAATSVAAGDAARPPRAQGDAMQVASICVKTGEKITGAIKTCFYNCAGAGASVDVPATTVCPMTVQK